MFSYGHKRFKLKVSVIISTYNHDRFIAQAINGVLIQETNFPFEVVIIEDCSTDYTRDIVIDYQRQYPKKIRLLLAERNHNDNRAWGMEILNAKGQYIALLDGDDYWTSSQKLQKQADFLDKYPQCSICFHNAKKVYEGDSQTSRNSNPIDQEEISTIKDLLKGNFIPTCTAMLRSGLLPRFPEWFYNTYAGDWALFLLAAKCGNIGYINEVMASWRIHSGGAWNGIDRIKQLKVRIQLYRNIRGDLDLKHYRMLTSQLSRCYYKLALEYEERNDLACARSCISKCFAERPINKYIPKLRLLRTLIRLYTPLSYKRLSASGK